MVGDDYNTAQPMIMHIDLNSCFATVEQQSRPRLRGRPVVIVNRRTEHTAIITASYEAKAYGVGVGMKLREARRLIPDLVALESDPAKYRFVYHRLMAIMRRYSAHVTMKSIDEGVIDFHQATQALTARNLRDIGEEIKQCLYDEIGRAMRCNVGIGTNRFLAKTAASLHKPNGLDVIDHTNLRSTFETLKLTQLTGIAEANARRLQAVGIATPLEFLDADEVTLKNIVFKSIVGSQWHQRLRGFEVDDVSHDIKTIGRQYVLEARDLSEEDILRRLHHLCESVGSKLRSQRKVTRGVNVYVRMSDGEYWHQRQLSQLPYYSDAAIYAQASAILRRAPTMQSIREIGVNCYHLLDNDDQQLSLFGDELARQRAVTWAVDDINQQFGARTIHSANTLDAGPFLEPKIPFGSTRFL